ncbi:hypothetical protein MO973_39245 [Paenibacillus sp. TRM 82003]|nr:hypothetical protein [Paenibacillus sp. TRM 82003]
MNEFHREYEYEEGSGLTGMLLIYFLSLISVDLLVAVVLFSQSSIVLGSSAAFPVWQAVWAVYGVAKLAYCISLFSKKRFVRPFTIVFLSVRLTLAAAATIVVAVYITVEPTLSSQLYFIGEKTDKPYLFFALPLLYVVAYSAGWILYFRKAEKPRTFFAA